MIQLIAQSIHLEAMIAKGMEGSREGKAGCHAQVKQAQSKPILEWEDNCPVCDEEVVYKSAEEPECSKEVGHDIDCDCTQNGRSMSLSWRDHVPLSLCIWKMLLKLFQ